MIRGSKQQRGATVQTKDVLDSAETGYVVGPSLGVRSTQPASSPFKRRKSLKSSGLGGLLGARFRRLLLKKQEDPNQLYLFITSIVTCAVFLGTSFVLLFLNFSTSAPAVKPDFKLSTRTRTHDPPMTNRRMHVLADKIFSSRKKKQILLQNITEIKILIKTIHPATKVVNLPNNDHFKEDLRLQPDFGKLKMVFYQDEGARRFIVKDDAVYRSSFRDPEQTPDDDIDAYYFFDDDYLRGLDTAYGKSNDVIDENKVCRKFAEHEYNFQNCNELHQMDRLNPLSMFKYLNSGAYRDVFSMEHSVTNRTELIAIKDTSFYNLMKHDDYEFVRMDAIVAERLTASPRIYDIYGFCGLGILSEYFYHGDIEEDVVGGDDGYMGQKDLHDEDEVKPQNNLTGIQKLVLALEMAEALADLHGYAHGLIVHDDVQLSQFLLDKNQTRLKLNDFNRAEFPLFDEENNEYCLYSNGRGHGNWRAPEEYKDRPLTEMIDVWSFGSNVYALLTGLNPLYDIMHEKELQKMIAEGETAYIDPRYKLRSPSEAILSELTSRCFQYKPEDRPTMFEIVRLLREGVAKNLKPGMTRQKVLQGIRTRQ